nr:hypothetical protein Iba_chr07aCG6020 [Ipomoea batatas]
MDEPTTTVLGIYPPKLIYAGQSTFKWYLLETKLPTRHLIRPFTLMLIMAVPTFLSRLSAAASEDGGGDSGGEIKGVDGGVLEDEVGFGRAEDGPGEDDH